VAWLGREFDALRVAFLWVLSFGEAKESTSTAGETREVDFAVGFVGFKVVSTEGQSAHADDDLHAASARRTGKRACLAKPSFTSKATPQAWPAAARQARPVRGAPELAIG
jgi:hypothetical protein